MEEKTRIILIGGFLGSGKTTLMKKTAEILAAEGNSIGLITNDQATALVDTSFLEKSTGITTKEVSGSCFCCNFPGLEEAIESIAEQFDTGVILAEPVGSCTDLSATILQTLKDRMGNRFTISPMSVLSDPKKLEDILAGGDAGLHISSAYIFRKQLEEADLILINKIDMIPAEKAAQLQEAAQIQYPQAKVLLISALDGTGVKEWLDEIMRADAAGTHLLEIDYDTYAEGEAVLGWLNTTVRITGEDVDWESFARELLQMTADEFAAMEAPIGHVKLMVAGTDSFVTGNLTGGTESLSVRGTSSSEPEVTLTFNARVQMPPEVLEEKTREMIARICEGRGRPEILVMESLAPGRPNPTYRYKEVIE